MSGLSKNLLGGLRNKGINKSSSSDLPLVSVITVVFNGEKYLEQTILSVLNQTYKNVEYIIVDGASTDETLDIIKKYNDRIDYWISEPDNGIYDAMNKGIKLANGELVGIIHSDDWYEHEAIKIVVNYALRFPEIGVFHGILRYIHLESVYQVIGRSDLFLSVDMIPHPTCFVRRELYYTFGFYMTKFKIAGDYEMMLRLRYAGIKFYFVEEVIANFRMEGVSSNFKSTINEKLFIQKTYGQLGARNYFLKRIQNFIRSFLSN